MSIAMNSGIDIGASAGFMRGTMSFGLLFEPPVGKEPEPVASSSSSSSIGKNSDVSGGSLSEDGDDCRENDEAQSSYKGPLDMMEALEEVLPIRRGISNFYNYKSKSFTSLVDATSTSSIKEIAKPDNAYTRKRRNLLASNLIWDKSRNFPLRSSRGGISKCSKKTMTTSQSTLALAVALSSSESSPTTSEDSYSRSANPCGNPPGCHDKNSGNQLGSHAAWRSLSLADLQECTISAAVNTTSRFFPSKPDLQS